MAEPGFEWYSDYHYGWLLERNGQRVMRVYQVQTSKNFRWAVEPWSGDPPKNPAKFYTLADAKTYCEVTAKLCGS